VSLIILCGNHACSRGPSMMSLTAHREVLAHGGDTPRQLCCKIQEAIVKTLDNI